MPRKPVIKLPPIDLGEETIGKRIARLRKERGLTQKVLAEKIGTSQSIVADYEIGRIRLYDEMVARFALALQVSADDIRGLKKQNIENSLADLKVTNRMREILKLPASKKRSLFDIIDAFLKANKE